MQHLDAVVGKAHVIERDLTLYAAEVGSVRRILYLGLGAHDLKKALKARRALHVYLGKLRELAHGVYEGRDVQREGDEVDVVKAAAHYHKSADGDDRDGHDTGREFHAAHERAHGLVVFLLCAAIELVCRVEFLLFELLVGEGLGRAHA